MERKYYLNPGNCIVCCLTCICFLILSAAMLTTSRYGTVLIFAATGILFGGLAVFFGITISIGPSGIRRSIAGHFTKALSWNEIAEVDVIGTNPFHSSGSKRTGTLYIYFSPRKLTEQERFDIVLHWPPLSGFFLVYDKKRMDFIVPLWGKPVETYNAGDISV